MATDHPFHIASTNTCSAPETTGAPDIMNVQGQPCATMIQAIIKSNQGVDQVEHGCYSNAVNSFTDALSILHPLVREQETNEGAPLDFQEEKVALSQQSKPQEQEQSNEGCSYERPKTPLEQCHIVESDNFIFQEPIEIPFHSVANSTPSPQLYSKISIVVLYNLGLSFHLCSIQRKSWDALNRARKIYELAFAMHMNDESCDVTILYTLALLNNLGLVYRALGESQRSQQCFHNLMSTMMYIMESNESRTIRQWDDFMSNVLQFAHCDIDLLAPAA